MSAEDLGLPDKIVPLDGKETIIRNRKAAVKALSENPGKNHQIVCSLTDGNTGRCALGIVADALNISLSRGGVKESIYDALEAALGGAEEVGSILDMNDIEGLAFHKIADKLCNRWNLNDYGC